MRKDKSNQSLCVTRPLLAVFAAAFIAVVMLTSVMKAEAASDTVNVSVTGTYNYKYAFEVLDLMNELRASVGAEPLIMDQTLLEYATQRAAETSLLFSHSRPNGEMCYTVGSRLDGENIAYGYISPEDVMNGWTNSAGHYANMINSSYQSVGIGCFVSSGGGIYWVQCFSRSVDSEATQPANGSKTVTVEITRTLATQLKIDLSKYLVLDNCKITSLTNKSGGIVVEWSQVDDASGYYVYRKTGSGSFKKIATITDASTLKYADRSVADADGTTYKYKVVAFIGSRKGTGTGKTIVRLTGTSLTAVTSPSSGTLKTEWEADANVTGYQLQYSTSSTFASYKTKKVSGATSVSKTLSSLKKGTKYYVRIRTYKTVNGKTYYSAWSSKLKVKITK